MRLRAVVPVFAVLLLLGGAVPAQAAAPVVAQPPAAVVQVETPFVLMTPGDSVSEHGGWQAEFCRILALETDFVCDLRNVAVGATTCAYWPSRIGALMATHSPDLVVFACGTNDNPAATAYGEPETSWAFRATVETIHYAQTPAVPIAPVFIQYADPLLPGSPQWLQGTIPTTNDRLYNQMGLYPSSWWAGIVDWQLVPSNATYLDATGFHPTARGYAYLGRLVYDAVRDGMGWPAASEPPLCDLYGHRKNYTRPAYTPC